MWSYEYQCRGRRVHAAGRRVPAEDAESSREKEIVSSVNCDCSCAVWNRNCECENSESTECSAVVGDGRMADGEDGGGVGCLVQQLGESGARGKILPQLAPVLSGGGGLGFARVKGCLYRGEARSLRHHLSRILNLRDSRSFVEEGFCGAAVAVPSPRYNDRSTGTAGEEENRSTTIQ